MNESNFIVKSFTQGKFPILFKSKDTSKENIVEKIPHLTFYGYVFLCSYVD